MEEIRLHIEVEELAVDRLTGNKPNGSAESLNIQVELLPEIAMDDQPLHEGLAAARIDSPSSRMPGEPIDLNLLWGELKQLALAVEHMAGRAELLGEVVLAQEKRLNRLEDVLLWHDRVLRRVVLRTDSRRRAIKAIRRF